MVDFTDVQLQILKVPYTWKDESIYGIPTKELEEYTHLKYPDMEGAINDLIKQGYVWYIQGSFPELYAKPMLGQTTVLHYKITKEGIALLEDKKNKKKEWRKRFDKLPEPEGDGADPAGLRV